MAFVELAPAHETLLRRLGLTSVEAFLRCPGVLVGGHRERDVALVSMHVDGQSHRYYLKRELRVRLRDRLQSWWWGLGWASKSVREARLLQQARALGIGCPEVVALGEGKRGAFVLLREVPETRELRAALADLPEAQRRGLAGAVGEAVARMHRAGFNHPDLYAKHVLLQGSSVVLLDWQRSRRVSVVSARQRQRDLAALDASLGESLGSPRVRLAFLRAYLRTLAPGPRQPSRAFALAVRALAARRGAQRKIRDLRQPVQAAVTQQLVPLDGGWLRATVPFARELGHKVPPILRFVQDTPRRLLEMDTRTVEVVAWRPGAEKPDLADALFRLERFGASVPTLLAYGRPQGRAHFILVDAMRAQPWLEALEQAEGTERGRLLREAGDCLRRVHEAGYRLAHRSLQALAVVQGRVHLVELAGLAATSAPWQHLARLELSPHEARIIGGLPRIDQLRLLLGYLQARRLDGEGRKLAEMLMLQGRVAERAAV